MIPWLAEGAMGVSGLVFIGIPLMFIYLCRMSYFSVMGSQYFQRLLYGQCSWHRRRRCEWWTRLGLNSILCILWETEMWLRSELRRRSYKFLNRLTDYQLQFRGATVRVQWRCYQPSLFLVTSFTPTTLLSLFSPISGWSRVASSITSSFEESMTSSSVKEPLKSHFRRWYRTNFFRFARVHYICTLRVFGQFWHCIRGIYVISTFSPRDLRVPMTLYRRFIPTCIVKANIHVYDTTKLRGQKRFFNRI